MRQILIVASCWFSLSLHNLLTMHGHRNLKIKFLVKLGNSGKKIREMLVQVYGDNSMKKTGIRLISVVTFYIVHFILFIYLAA